MIGSFKLSPLTEDGNDNVGHPYAYLGTYARHKLGLTNIIYAFISGYGVKQREK